MRGCVLCASLIGLFAPTIVAASEPPPIALVPAPPPELSPADPGDEPPLSVPGYPEPPARTQSVPMAKGDLKYWKTPSA